MTKNQKFWIKYHNENMKHCECCGGLCESWELEEGICKDCYDEINEIESSKTGWDDLERLGYI